MSEPLTEAEVKVLRAVQDGAALTRHTRPDRGPYYLMAGRRLSMPLVKGLEEKKLIVRVGTSGTAPYTLTPAGLNALEPSKGTE